MPLASSGTISLSQVQTEFGGTNPISMSEYYTNAVSGFTSGISGLPSSGTTVSLSVFRGKAKTQLSIPAEIVIAGTTSTTIGTNERCIVFPYSGSGTTKDYTFTTTEDLLCDILIVGGGGGGGNYGGGGGGGDVIQKSNVLLIPGTYSISVGTGGAGGVNPYNKGANGTTSSITSLGLFAAGGGGGGGYNQTPATTPTAGSIVSDNYSSGGGGGGGAGGLVPNNGETGNSVSGNGGSNGSQSKGGGGGGASGNGTNATASGAGNGGAGVSTSISGIVTNYGGGGGGGTWSGGTFGIGVDGGGNGAVEGSGVNPVPGTRGGGGGGGGGSTNTGGIINMNGANGGSGIVIIRYRRSPTPSVPGNLSSKTLQEIYTTVQPYLNEYKNVDFYEYSLNGNDTFILDGLFDMYDSGNYTKLIADGVLSTTLSYNTTTASTVTVNGKTSGYISLGYTRPLIMLGKSATRASWGFQKSGELGADTGIANWTNFTLYNGNNVNGYTVYAWVRQVYNAKNTHITDSDPTVCDLYFAIGDSTSTFYSSTMTTVDPQDANSDLSSMSIDSVNVLFGTILCSKQNGVYITEQECKNVLIAFINRLKSGLGLYPYLLNNYAPQTNGVAVPYSDLCTTVVTSTGQSAYDNLPVVSYGGYNWLLQHNFGTTGRWNGLQLRNFTTGLTIFSNAQLTSQNYTSLPSTTSQIYTDWAPGWSYGSAYGIGGFNNTTNNGPNNIYSNYNTLFQPYFTSLGYSSLTNPGNSSSMIMYIPSWAKQVCLVAADLFREDNSGSNTRKNSYWWSANGITWTNLGVASWRGSSSNQYGSDISQNPSSNADMMVFNVSTTGYLLILESGNTITSIAFVLLKP